MPIKSASGQVIGVSQLINKLDDTPFNKNDENLFEVRKGIKKIMKTGFLTNMDAHLNL